MKFHLPPFNAGNWRRARRMPLRELAAKAAGRITTHLGNQAERMRWPLWKNRRLQRAAEKALWRGPEGGNGESPASLRVRMRPALFLAVEDRKDEWLRRFGSRPGTRENVLSDAEKIMAHEFDLLGSGPVRLAEKIPWHEDFKSGHVWPVIFHKTLWVYNPWDDSDVKVPWELSRFQHLPLLGKAWWLTGDERFAREAAEQMRDWIRENPVGMGVNWKCPMDVAIRAVNWLHAWAMFYGSPSFTEMDWRNILTVLYRHGQFIRDNLEYNPRFRGNHYLSDVVGLIFLGRAFESTPEGREWLEFGIRELRSEMAFQVFPDGVNQEMSTAYHRLVTELFAWGAAAALRREGDEAWRERLPQVFGADFAPRLKAMFDYAAAFTRPDGNMPLFGDHDDGRLHLLGAYSNWRKDSALHLLGTGACLFGKPGWWKQTGPEGEEEGWWLAGEAAVRALEREAEPPEPPSSRAFKDAGFYVMREGGNFLMLRCGPMGMKGRGSHDHCDQLSVEVSLQGQPLVADPGAYVYTADPSARSLFRSTPYHNTLVVDGAEQNDFDSYNLFQMRERSFARCLRWEGSAERDVFEGEHAGYGVLEKGLCHVRRVEFHRAAGAFVISDRVNARGSHRYAWFWHLSSSVRVAGLEDGSKTFSGRTYIQAAVLETRAGRFILAADFPDGTVEEGWISRSYGRRQKSAVFVWRAGRSGPVEHSFLLAPEDLWRRP